VTLLEEEELLEELNEELLEELLEDELLDDRLLELEDELLEDELLSPSSPKWQSVAPPILVKCSPVSVQTYSQP